MKFFIIFAIIFFSWRVVTAAEEYYYEGRYYKIDEYIRFQDDPNYQAYLNEKRAEERAHRTGVDEYFVERDQDAAIQEKNRLAYLKDLENEPQEEIDYSKLEAEHEKEKAEEAKLQAKAAQEYLAMRDQEYQKAHPTRMVASVFETEEDKPLKRVPRENRKFIPKPKAPLKKAK